MTEYHILYSETSRKQIAKLHPDIKPVMRSRLDRLKKEPLAGKRLERELSGYRSLRARRFRIIYKVNDENKSIEIHYVGHRRDIYELFAGKSGKVTGK
jgi:mRNA interferase RelE/StbE